MIKSNTIKSVIKEKNILNIRSRSRWKKKKKLKGNLKVVPTTLILALILICPLATEMLC